MESGELAQMAGSWANYLLTWVGFGTLVALLAKAIMPGRDPGGAVATLLIGIGGTIIGCGLLTFFYQGERVTPISWQGFIVGTAGSFLILIFYRILSGWWFVEGDVVSRKHSYRRRRSRSYHAAHEDV